MHEKWPFVWFGTITEEERVSIYNEIMAFPAWAVSNVPCLTDRRDYVALTTSSKRGNNEDGKSYLGIGTEGSFSWRDHYICPTIQMVAERVRREFDSAHFGTVMVSRMLPGAVVSIHRDMSSYYDVHHRVQICIDGNDKTRFVCDGQTKIMKPREMWTFRNTGEHEVFNEGDTTRIALVVDVLDKNYVFPEAS